MALRRDVSFHRWHGTLALNASPLAHQSVSLSVHYRPRPPLEEPVTVGVGLSCYSRRALSSRTRQNQIQSVRSSASDHLLLALAFLAVHWQRPAHLPTDFLCLWARFDSRMHWHMCMYAYTGTSYRCLVSLVRPKFRFLS
jgi:hypothetical protein